VGSAISSCTCGGQKGASRSNSDYDYDNDDNNEDNDNDDNDAVNLAATNK
jgi:hypothetical protein